MIIRKATIEDIDAINLCIEAAKSFMRSYGNTFQWDGTDYPGSKILSDIENGYAHVVEDEGRVHCYFAFIPGVDPCYVKIEGKWLDDKPYAAVHRVASDGKCHHLLEEILDYCFERIDSIRIDTHEANAPMRHKLDKLGFAYCGTVYMEDGTPRRAYQKNK